jgi:pseudouridine synthase
MQNKKSSSPKRPQESSAAIRLQKFISLSGVASRRRAEEMIRQGLVTVNGKTVRQLGTKVDPSTDRVQVEGVRVRRAEKPVTVLLNKPRSYLCSLSDPENRPLVTDLVKKIKRRVYPVGRLDFNTEGLLLLTDDGDLAHNLTRTANKVPKTYMVKVSGSPSPQVISKLRRGVRLEDGMTAPAEIKLQSKTKGGNAWLSVTLIEGRNRQIHRMFRTVGHQVSKIKRVRIGPLELGDLPPGGYRVLSDSEVKRLKGS